MDSHEKNLHHLLEKLEGALGSQHTLLEEVRHAFDREERALRAARAQIARAERLQLAGTVAAQIAHDFRNLLAPLIMLPHIIRKSLKENDPNLEHLKEIERAAKDMVQMTADLSALSSRGQTEYESVSLNDVVEQVASLVAIKASSSGVTVKMKLQDSLLSVNGAPDQLVRTVQNLAENAIDAMKQGGTLTIRTEQKYFDVPTGIQSRVEVGEYVCITVSDTGSGIPENVRDKIFDPFFTTKRTAVQRSSGLGLSIVHSIIRDHDGFVDFESKVGSGTTFYLYIPVSREAVRDQATTAEIKGGDESILVVDDDLQQIELIALLLTTLGYKVDGVESGAEALEFLKSKKTDVVILDIVMPEMDGVETLRRIRKLNPEQRVVLVSGFDRAPAIEKARQMDAPVFIRKPVSLEDIARAVRQELERTLPPHKQRC